MISHCSGRIKILDNRPHECVVTAAGRIASLRLGMQPRDDLLQYLGFKSDVNYGKSVLLKIDELITILSL